VKYVYDVIKKEILDKTHKEENRMTLFYEYYRFKFLFFLYGIYFSFLKWWDGCNNEDVDLNINF